MPTLPYDDSGENPANLVSNELIDLEATTSRVAVLMHGAFYADSLVLTYAGSGTPVDMEKVQMVGLDPLLTAAAGQPVVSGILFPDDIDDPIILNVRGTYQAVGGEQGEQTFLIKKLREAVESLDMGEISIGDITDFPPTWPPSPHGHDLLDDVTGLEPIRAELAAIKEALVGRRPLYNSSDRLSARIDRLQYLLARIRNDLNQVRNTDSSVVVASNTVDFQSPKIYGSAAAPRTGAVLGDLTGAKLGVVQQMYHNDSTLVVDPTWVRCGTGAYVEDELNIIWIQWGQGTRVEYWMSQEGA